MAELQGGAGGKLGINGLGRIAKLTIWHHVEAKHFPELVVNIGRQVGGSLNDIAHFIERDSTYGRLEQFLFGRRGTRVIDDLREGEGSMRINGIRTTFLRQARNPAQIGWRERGVELVVDATGAFLDPTIEADAPNGSLRGHLLSGARKIILSAPFKIKDKEKSMPVDAVTTVMGINDFVYAAQKHSLISGASCTTTCLAYMVKPLLDHFSAKRILSAAMTTVHAATSSQQVLDRAPKALNADLRKNRSVLNNVILTSTGAAKALGLVLPEMKRIGFISESVRIPTNTGSLIILVVQFQDDDRKNPINRELINGIYSAAMVQYPHLFYTEEQNVSSDIIGASHAVVIEGHETHTRSATIEVDISTHLARQGVSLSQAVLDVPVTMAVVYGWYDNELGSYTNLLGDMAVRVAQSMK